MRIRVIYYPLLLIPTMTYAQMVRFIIASKPPTAQVAIVSTMGDAHYGFAKVSIRNSSHLNVQSLTFRVTTEASEPFADTRNKGNSFPVFIAPGETVSLDINRAALLP